MAEAERSLYTSREVALLGVEITTQTRIIQMAETMRKTMRKDGGGECNNRC
jgi:hypothetical protein